MIVFDWETTGLPLKGNAPLDKQPHVIEFAGIKLDDEAAKNGECIEIDRLEFLCKPPIAVLDPKITQITGITMNKIGKTLDTDDVEKWVQNPSQNKPLAPSNNPRYLSDKPPFKAYYNKLVDFFFGQREAYAHNVRFDSLMLEFELRRIEKLTQFPWPPKQICTVEKTSSIKNRRLKLIELYSWLFGEEFKGAHEAMNDVEALARCIIELKSRGML